MATIQQKYARGSPSVKGPIKATETFGLRQSPNGLSFNKASRINDYSLVRSSETASRKPQRRSPETRTSPEFIVQPGIKEQRRRPSTRYDAVGAYVKGEWPKEIQNYQLDKAIQTESEDYDELTDAKGRPFLHRSSSAGRGDAGKREKLRNLVVKPNKPISQKTISSPTLFSRGTSTWSQPISNSLLTSSALLPTSSSTFVNGSSIPTSIPTASSSSLSSAIARSKTINIPMARVLPFASIAIKGSVEGDNVEIEKLWAFNQSQHANTHSGGMDGRQAPVVEILGLIRQQQQQQQQQQQHMTVGDSDCDGEGSPVNGMFVDMLLNESSPAVSGSSLNASPDAKGEKDDELPKSILIRLPPDGCEKIKTIDERRPSSDNQSFTLIKTGQFCIPSAQSAFCPLLKPYMSQSNTDIDMLLQP